MEQNHTKFVLCCCIQERLLQLIKPTIMKNLLFSLGLSVILYSTASAQSVAIGSGSVTPHSSSILDLQSTDKGFLVPRVANPSTIASPATGLLVYNTTTNKFNFFDGSAWSEVGGGNVYTGGTGISVSGTVITNTAPHIATNLAQGTRTTTTVPVTSSTGTAATLQAATVSLAGVMTAADKAKLDGIAAGATANTGTVTGTGAANKVAFWTSASALSSNTNFHWDNTNGRLGIGTASPAFALDVNASLRISENNTTGGGIFLADDGSIVDNNDGYATHRFSKGIMVTDGNNTNNRRALVTNMGNVIASAGLIAGSGQMKQGPGTGADNQWHTVELDNGFGMMNLSIYSSSRFDGDIRINGIFLRDLLNDGVRNWYGANGALSGLNGSANTQTCDNCDHFASCPDNYIATGFQVYATSQLDYYGKLRCTQLKSGFTTVETGAGFESAISAPWNTGRDDQQHFAMCPTGTFVKGFRVYASNYWDGALRVYCTGITGQ
jgi:hypothetical protein